MGSTDILIVGAMLLGVLSSGGGLAFLVVLLLYERRRVSLTYPSARRLRRRAIDLLSILGGLFLGVGGICGFYRGVVPCLRGYNDDANRTILYWLYRYAFLPLGMSLDESAWNVWLARLSHLPAILGPLFFFVGFILARRLLSRMFSMEPSDWLPQCPACLYNLTGNVSGVCPECGSPVPGRDDV